MRNLQVNKNMPNEVCLTPPASNNNFMIRSVYVLM